MSSDTPHWRPRWHFSPRQQWINDPNGLVYDGGVYHLYFQHHPNSAVWGPMHWGHASSQDLVSWTEHAIALAPDALGMIFSGSAVLDSRNTSGLGIPEQAPWLAVYTQHDNRPEAYGSPAIQTQSLAVSLDGGFTWKPHAGNPVLPSPGLRDFRDPKVIWHEPSQTWVMVLAEGDRIGFYGSADLKVWKRLSAFGPGANSHSATHGCGASTATAAHTGELGGVWECPDLFELVADDGSAHWVLLVSLVPGGPAGGSGTQVFVGHFDGQRFTPHAVPPGAAPLDAGGKALQWLDHGPDHYAGVTWFNAPRERVLVAWMNNWLYAKDLPTHPWRGAMTLPRSLSLRRCEAAAAGYWLCQWPARETWPHLGLASPAAQAWQAVSDAMAMGPATLSLALHISQLASFEIVLANEFDERLVLGYDEHQQLWFVDRRHAGASNFNPSFAPAQQARYTAKRRFQSASSEFLLVLDACSVELFAEGGACSITALVFPRQAYNKALLNASPSFEARIQGLKSNA